MGVTDDLRSIETPGELVAVGSDLRVGAAWVEAGNRWRHKDCGSRRRARGSSLSAEVSKQFMIAELR